MKALVLTGGAARGVYAAGVLEGLLATETFDIVCGSSVGALNGLAVALDRGDLLRELWSRIAGAGILALAEPLASFDRIRHSVRALQIGSPLARLRAAQRLLGQIPGLGRLGALRRLMAIYDQRVLRDVLAPLCQVDALKRTFIVGVTDLTNSADATFYAFADDPAGDRERLYVRHAPGAQRLTSANALDALCASSALPGAFAPVSIALANGSTVTYADGGIANNAPIRQAIDAGATDVTVILLQHSGLRYRERTIRSPGDVAFIMHDIVQERILELELSYVRAVNELVRHGVAAPGQRFINVRVIGPSVPLRLSSMSFNDQASIDRVYNLGVADGWAAQEVSRFR